MKSALIIIDVQMGAFDGKKIPPIENPNEFLGHLKKLIQEIRKKNIPIVYIQDCGQIGGAFEKDSEHWPIHPQVKPKDEDFIILKKHSNAFENTKLKNTLDHLNVKSIIITGVHSEKCVKSTLDEAIRLGYLVSIPIQGHSTILEKGASFKNKIQSINNYFRHHGAEVKDVGEILQSL